MRVALVDPLAYTPPYDHHLAAALGRRGHDVTLLTSAFLHGDAPESAGYRREELFLPVSTRLLRGAPRARFRLALKGIEYLPSVARLLRRVKQLDADVVHLQWLPQPELDVRWLRRLGRPTVLTAHDVFPRRERALPAWRRALGLVDRVIVHSERAAEQLREFDPVLIRPLPRIPEARLIVAGDPLDPVEPARRLAGELGVADRIEWRLRFIGDMEIRDLMENAALVALPYRQLDSSGVLAAACSSLLEDGDALQGAYEGAAKAAASLTWDAAAQEHERVYEEIRSTNRSEL